MKTINIQIPNETHGALRTYAFKEGKTLVELVPEILREFLGLKGEVGAEAHKSGRAGVVGGATAKAGSNPDSASKIEGLLRGGEEVRGSQIDPEDFEPGEFDGPDYLEVETPELQETRLTFDDLGEMKVRIKCEVCGKLMKAAVGSEDTMMCPSGHRETLIELRRKGKL